MDEWIIFTRLVDYLMQMLVETVICFAHPNIVPVELSTFRIW